MSLQGKGKGSMYNLLLNKYKIRKLTRAQELIILLTSIFISLLASIDSFVDFLYPNSFSNLFFIWFPYFDDISMRAGSSSQKVKLYFIIMTCILPVYLILTYTRFSLNCIEVKNRLFEYSIGCLVFFPFLVYVIVAMVTSPLNIEFESSYLSKLLVAFSMKSPIHLGLAYAGLYFLFCTAVVIPIKFMQCFLDKNKES